MNIDDDKKVDILLLALKERYESLHKIRERVQAVGIWVLGMLLGVSGWAIQSEKILTSVDKFLFITGVILAFGVFRYIYLSDLQKGFKSQQRTASRIESALKLYEMGAFSNNEKSIYPLEWENAGMDNGGGKFFGATQSLLLVGITIFIFSVLFGGSQWVPTTQCGFQHHWQQSQMR